jgi:hypothetical protein
MLAAARSKKEHVDGIGAAESGLGTAHE